MADSKSSPSHHHLLLPPPSIHSPLRPANPTPSPPTDLRSHDPSADKILGDKAVGGLDADKDHVPNVVSGLKATLNNDKVSDKAKQEAEVKLHGLEKLKEGEHDHDHA